MEPGIRHGKAHQPVRPGLSTEDVQAAHFAPEAASKSGSIFRKPRRFDATISSFFARLQVLSAMPAFRVNRSASSAQSGPSPSTLASTNAASFSADRSADWGSGQKIVGRMH